jgi:hypothetical protein
MDIEQSVMVTCLMLIMAKSAQGVLGFRPLDRNLFAPRSSMALHLTRCARLQRLPLRALAVPIGSSEVSFENMKRILISFRSLLLLHAECKRGLLMFPMCQLGAIARLHWLAYMRLHFRGTKLQQALIMRNTYACALCKTLKLQTDPFLCFIYVLQFGQLSICFAHKIDFSLL